jgi:alkanesulfonate monooxygenase SsuD/methylene tetrahydromethanopterin reductase-like flavin-dependent oxidoreductase (luciferase family)
MIGPTTRKEGAMATGTARGFAVFAGIAPEVIRATAREAESRGFVSFWVNHPGPVDGLGSLAQAAAETQRIALGIGVIPLHTRGPEDIVAGVRQHGLAPTRLLLGVGSPNPQALRRVREGVAAIRRTLQTRVIVAALGPKMCHVAGEVADGVLFNWLTPEYARRSAELVRAGATAAGRPMPRTYAYVRVALGGAAGARLHDEGGRYAAIPAYGAHFERMGVKPAATGVAASSAADIKAGLAAWEGAVDEIVLRAIVANDTLDDHLTLLRAC